MKITKDMEIEIENTKKKDTEIKAIELHDKNCALSI